MRKYEKEGDELVKCTAGDKHLRLKLNAVRRNEGRSVEKRRRKRKKCHRMGQNDLFKKETKRKQVSEKQVDGSKTLI